MENWRINLATMLREHRCRLGLSQANLGIRQATVSAIERGADARLSTLELLLDNLGLELVARPRHKPKKRSPLARPETVSVKSLGFVVPRFWSGPDEQPVETVLAAVLAKPVYEDLIAVAERFGIAQVRAAYRRGRETGEISEILVPTIDRMLENIEIGFSAR